MPSIASRSLPGSHFSPLLAFLARERTSFAAIANHFCWNVDNNKSNQYSKWY